MPGINITNDDRKNIDIKRFICCSCDLLLYFPMQTICGHLICQSCVEELLKSSNPKCPEDGEKLSEEKVFPDAYTRRELKNIQIHCSNPGCSWFSTYDQHEDHSKICEYALIKCTHSQCQGKFQRSYLEEHLKSECEYRNVKCDYCGNEVSLPSIKNHVDQTCESVLVTCKYCKQNFLRKDIKNHERLSCDEVPANCEFQAVGCNHNKTLKRKELRQHCNDGLIYHVRLLLRYILDLTSQIFRKLTGLERRIQSLTQAINQQPIHSNNGILLWRIEGYQRKRQDAINGVEPALYSPPFYSAQHEYKMCAKLYLNGEGAGEGTHLSLFFIMMKGDYDALLSWPFREGFDMTLLDQSDDCNHVRNFFQPDIQSPSCQRPISDMNTPDGLPLFISIDDLNEHQYIKDDVMFIRINVVAAMGITPGDLQ